MERMARPSSSPASRGFLGRRAPRESQSREPTGRMASRSPFLGRLVNQAEMEQTQSQFQARMGKMVRRAQQFRARKDRRARPESMVSRSPAPMAKMLKLVQ
jgi:hypothetical protein